MSGPRAVLLGAGLMGRWHAYACARAGGQVAAVVDPDLQAARKLAAAYRGAAAAPSLEALPQDLAPQIVHVCSPPDTHETAIGEAFSRGCPAIVEKPAAPTADATARIVDAGTASRLWIEPVHQLVFQQGVVRARAWLRDMGTVRLFDYRACSAGAEARPGLAASIAGEILPHPLSLLDVLLPDSLARLERWHAASPSPGELSATTAAGTAVVRVFISMAGRPTRHDLTIVADEGTIALDLFHGFAWRERRRSGRLQKLARPFVASGACAAAAAATLARRTGRREWAYPGLLPLVALTYASLSTPDARPLGDRHLLAVAKARDEVLRAM